MKKKIILSLGMIVFAAAVALTATGAFFSDTETSTGNTFTAGDIDLKIDNTSYVTNTAGVLVASAANTWTLADLTNQLFFSFADVKPGDVGEDTISIHAGSNDAFTCMAADITATPENSLVDSEVDVADAGPANADNGELQNFLNFSFWNDDGDNVFETGETQITALTGPANTIFQGAWSPVGSGAIPGNSTRYVAKAWCFGTLTAAPVTQDNLTTSGPLTRGTGFTCNGAGQNNIAQTDGVKIDVSFQAVQARNNANFTCASLPTFVGTGTSTDDVNQADLETGSRAAAKANDKWFFYNDTTDLVMTIDQTSGTGGQDHMEAVAGSEGAKMLLGTEPNPRYNIATYRYNDVLLSSLGTLSYRVYDTTNDSDKPYLHFNVDFFNTNTFQSRLVYVPPTLPVNTWTTVDAIQGGAALWTYSGANWPAATAGPDFGGPVTPGTTARTWNNILADYPNIQTLSTDSWLGVRVGEPGPAGATGFVDWINVGGEVSDFKI